MASTLSTHWTIALALIPSVIVIGGYIFSMGRLRGTMATKKELQETKDEFQKFCKENQTSCSVNVVSNIHELKVLVVDLHDKQTTKIDEMDSKRELAKDDNHKEIKALTQALGKVEGVIETYFKKEA